MLIRWFLLVLLVWSAGCSSTVPTTIKLRPVANSYGFSGDYIDVASADRPPILQKPTMPRYPTLLRRNGVSGAAEIAYIVETDGTTSQVQVVAANDVEFGEAARAAVAQWRFRPGLKDGRPVRVVVKQVISFDVGFD